MNKKPTSECRYGVDCYRKYPGHFREYKHAHLEKILDEYDGSGDFKIPESLSFQAVVEEQLKIIHDNKIYVKGDSAVTESITSKNKNTSDTERKAKRAKLEMTESGSKASQSTSSVCEDVSVNTQESKAKESSPSTGRKLSLPTNNQDARDKPKPVYNRRRIEDVFDVVAPKGKMAAKHFQAAPFYIFFTTVTAAPQTHTQPLSITFQELLDRSLGNLQSSLQINFMVDIGWLLAHYYFAGYNDKPLTILYGEDTEDLSTINKKKPNVQAFKVPMQNAFGKHHTKMSLLCYDDGSVRVVVSTANLLVNDWDNKTQGLWLSPKCPRLADPSDFSKGDSVTGFKASLIKYLSSYKMGGLSLFIDSVKGADFSDINVFFVASIPGGHFDSEWGLSRISSLLTKHCAIPSKETDKWDFIAQASSLGSFGKDPKLWLTGDFQRSFCSSMQQTPLMTRLPALRLVYPTLRAVKHSHEDLMGGSCLPYSNSVHVKQTWLNAFLHEWKAKVSGRHHAMPHIKSYLRLSPDAASAPFFLLTSANVSKSAWGSYNKGNRALRINSYEAGVLFLPKFVMSKDLFSVASGDPDRLPVPYDLPPTKYTANDTPWVQEHLLNA